MQEIKILSLLLGCMLGGLVMIILDQVGTGGGWGTWRGVAVMVCSGALLLFLYRHYMD